jgi:hypothetical protein
MKAEPWLVPAAVTWLEERIEPWWTAFEWGSGGSTLWLENLCESVYSVEHDESWFWKVAASSTRPKTTRLQLCRPQPGELGDDPANPDHYRSSCLPGDWHQYAQAVDLEGPFDLVVVDGRARASCIARAVPRVKGGGVLVLDNAEREWYLEQTEHLLDGWEKTDFRQGAWLTSAWTRS